MNRPVEGVQERLKFGNICRMKSQGDFCWFFWVFGFEFALRISCSLWVICFWRAAWLPEWERSGREETLLLLLPCLSLEKEVDTPFLTEFWSEFPAIECIESIERAEAWLAATGMKGGRVGSIGGRIFISTQRVVWKKDKFVLEDFWFTRRLTLFGCHCFHSVCCSSSELLDARSYGEEDELLIFNWLLNQIDCMNKRRRVGMKHASLECFLCRGSLNRRFVSEFCLSDDLRAAQTNKESKVKRFYF